MDILLLFLHLSFEYITFFINTTLIESKLKIDNSTMY